MLPKSRVSRVVVAGFGAALLAGRAWCAAGDATFDFRVDRFELVRTTRPGASRNLPDFVDEFDDPRLGWGTWYGTAFAADGFLHLASPGTEIPDALGVLPGTTLDLSLVGSPNSLSDGEGSFIARSYWEPDELARGDFNHMSFSTYGRDAVEVSGLAIMNATPDGQPTAYTIVQHFVSFGAGVPGPPQLATVAIDPSAITGQIVFELRFDDDTNALETAFSLDGGVTFERPFLPLTVFNKGTWYGYFLLGADPLTNTVRAHLPAPPLCARGNLFGDAKIVSSSQAGSTIAVVGTLSHGPLRRRDYDPHRAGAQIRIIDRAHPETPILDLTSAAALPAGPGCGSRDGWRRVSSGFVYRNETNALPPGCVPGSAGGLRRFRLKSRAPLRWQGWVGGRGFGYEIDLATPWQPLPGARVATTLVLGDATGAPCGTSEVRCVASETGVSCEQDVPRRPQGVH